MKICNTCVIEKPFDDFHRMSSALDGRQGKCKQCVSEYGHAYQKRTYYQKTYGFGRDQYERMADKQSGACAVCGWKGDLCVDHDHATGAVRELLCRQCNAALGLLGENPERIIALAAYAVKHSKAGVL